jgi:predicted transcriptional regulator
VSRDTELLAKLKVAVAAVNNAEQGVRKAQAEFVSRSKVAGLLLLEAKKLHPAVKDFQTFLKKVDGLRAVACIRPAAAGWRSDNG